MSNKIILSASLGVALACIPAFSNTSSKTSEKAMSDQSFLTMAAEADMTSAHIGQMAEERSDNSKVKEFAKTLVQDHTNDYKQLGYLGVKTSDTIPNAIDRSNERTIAALEHYRGKTFDQRFLSQLYAEHQRLVHVFKEESEHGSNPAIRAYANKTLPTIERHLQDAHNLIKQGS